MRYMRVKYSQLHDMLISLVDFASTDQDSLSRLTNTVALERELRTLVKQARNKAAYEAKKEYSLAHIKKVTNLSTDTINYWMRAHRKRTGAPPLYGLPKRSMEGAMDLSAHHQQEEPSRATSALEPTPDHPSV